jgi:hypothetical protein
MRRLLPIAKEIARRREHPHFVYEPDTSPLRNQLAAHKCKAPIILASGGNQSGKSRWGAQDCAWWLTEAHPFLVTPHAPQIYVISAQYRTIAKGIWRHLVDGKVLPEWEIAHMGPKVPQSDVRTHITCKRGGRVEFISAEGGEAARRKVQAAELDAIYIDEEVSDEIWREVFMRLLASGGRVAITATLVSSPNWILELEDRAAKGDPSVKHFKFSSKRAMEVGHLSKRHYKMAEAMMTEEEKDVRLHGKSRRSHGLVYQEFGAHNTCRPFTIPDDWTRYCSLDPGWRTFAVLWAAVSPSRDHYVLYRELYLHGTSLKEVADKIYAAEGYKHLRDADVWVEDPPNTEKTHRRWIDPSAFNTETGGAMGLAHLLRLKHRLRCTPARNELDVGIELCRRDLMQDMDGEPKMRVFTTLHSFLAEIRSYRRFRDNPSTWISERSDKPIKRADHLLDCWRYMVLGKLVMAKPNLVYGDAAWLKEFEAKPETGSLLEQRRQRDLKRIMRHVRTPKTDPPLIGGIGNDA